MSKNMRVSVYFSAASTAALHARTPNGEKPNVSGTTNELIRRYEWLVKSSLPELSSGEWQTLINVYSGCWLGEFVSPARIASDMMDDAGAISVDELEPNYAALVRKAHGWNQAEQMAVLDFIQRFWCGDWDGCADFDEIKARITGG